MLLIRLILTLFVLFSFNSLAQDVDDAVKEKQRQRTLLLEQIISDVPELKLPENRAYVYAQTGNLMRQTDAKRARELFQNSVNELITAQTSAEADKKNAPYLYDLLNSQSLRPQILQIIAYQDAEFALESFYKTRPSNISKALAGFQGNSSEKVSGNQRLQVNLSFAQNEINLEQRLLTYAADQNPERAVKLLEKSLDKGITGETLNSLKKLQVKDAAKAQEILSEVTRKLLKFDYNFSNQNNNVYYSHFSAALIFLSEFIREKSKDENALRFDEGQFTNLADIIISALIKTDNPNAAYFISSLIPIAKKLFPNRVEILKQKQSKLSRYQRGDFGYNPEATELLQSDTAPEKLLSEADKFPSYIRTQIYQRAANKYAEQGNAALAEKILNDNLSDEELENALNNLIWQKTNKAINEGNFNIALELINQLPENMRVNSLLSLADNIYQKNPQENKSFAVSVLEQARALTGDKPKNSTEMNYLLQIISKYSHIEPGEGFRLFEPLISQINELSEAAVLLSGFNGNSQIRQGEMTFMNGNAIGVYLGEIDTPLRSLAKADFSRTMQIIERFQRRETRISLRLKLAETMN